MAPRRAPSWRPQPPHVQATRSTCESSSRKKKPAWEAYATQGRWAVTANSYGIVVEGPYDVAIFPELIRRVLSRDVPIISRPCFGKDDLKKDLLTHVRNLQKVQAVIVRRKPGLHRARVHRDRSPVEARNLKVSLPVILHIRATGDRLLSLLSALLAFRGCCAAGMGMPGVSSRPAVTDQTSGFHVENFPQSRPAGPLSYARTFAAIKKRFLQQPARPPRGERVSLPRNCAILG